MSQEVVTDSSVLQTSAQSLDEFWKVAWGRNHTAWQLDHTNATLVQYYDRLFPTPGQASRVLLPLCGKSLDMVFLWQKGHEVTGIEAVEAAIPAFCEASGIQLQAVTDDGLVRHQTPDKRLQILVTDFFNIPDPRLDHSFTVAWDRASLYAVEPELRPAYAETMRRLLHPTDFRYLLTTVVYDDSVVSGPPYNIPESEVRSLFQSFADVQFLEEKGMSFKLTKFTEKGVVVKEVVYLLTPKHT